VDKELASLNFSERLWFNVKLFPSFKDSKLEISDATQRKRMQYMTREGGVFTTKGTHVTRGSSIRMLSEMDSDTKRHLGHWNAESMTNCYEGLPLKGVRAVNDVGGNPS
jgi:hypothetical protein